MLFEGELQDVLKDPRPFRNLPVAGPLFIAIGAPRILLTTLVGQILLLQKP
jgi:hypothetical protein